MDRKEKVRQYRETPRPAGVYRVLHQLSGRYVFGASPDAPAMLNRIRAQLSMSGHPNRELQRDWDTDGEDAFAFEVVDLLPPPKNPSDAITDDLATLRELWSDRLQLEDGSAY
jgi:hypothetical protein